MNAKVFNLISRVDEARFTVQHESCECICRLNESVCNSKQKWKWNTDECWCEHKESDDCSSCENGYMWNPSMCDWVSGLDKLLTVASVHAVCTQKG